MGFKDLRLFNLALLAKHGWRLITKKESLLYRIYKARYFNNTSLFDAKVGLNSSFAWKCIREAVQGLARRCRWRVGNGKFVRVFQDPWIPDFNMHYINQAEVEGVGLLRVQSLIDVNTGWWKIDTLRALFNPNVVQQILKLNVNLSSDDSLFWVHEKNGIYSVKSAYRVLQQDQSQVRGQNSNGSSHLGFWKCLWGLKMPKKMKIFGWKACQELLPTYQNLKKKHVLESDQCVFYNQASEDAAHALFFCSHVRKVWLDFCSQMGNVELNMSFWDLANLAQERGVEDLLVRFFAIAWGLWYRRNKFLYEQVSMQINVVVNNALSIQQEYKLLQVFDVSNKKINRIVSWHPPPIGFLKLNVDGAIFYDQNSAGVGVLLRDHNGDVVVACSKVEREVFSAEFIEATALLRGLQLCAQWGVPKVLLESDCLILVHTLNNLSEYRIDFDFILQDIHRLMMGFQEVKVVHVHRLGNMAAHQLARYAWEVDDVVMWWDFCPSFVSQAIWLDKNSICKDSI